MTTFMIMDREFLLNKSSRIFFGEAKRQLFYEKKQFSEIAQPCIPLGKCVHYDKI